MVTVRPRSSGCSELIVSKTRCQFCSHELSTSSRLASACITNSRSRLRSGFSPSLVRKPVKRERMLRGFHFARPFHRSTSGRVLTEVRHGTAEFCNFWCQQRDKSCLYNRGFRKSGVVQTYPLETSDG